MSRKAPRVDAAAWDRYKEEIISFYRESSLKETMVKMNDKHGFQASENQYRAKLKVWKIGKHATPDVWLFVNDRMKKRTRTGKKTDVLLYGELQPPRKVAKEIARNVTLVDSLQDLSDAPTPGGVEIQTPSSFSPVDRGTVGIHQTKSMCYSEFVGLMTPWIVGVVASHTPLCSPDPPSQLYDMFRWYNISPCSESLLQSLSSDLTKYVSNKRFNDLLEYWGKDHTTIRSLAVVHHMELAQVGQTVLLMVYILLFEANNIHDRLEPSDAVFILQEHFPSALKDMCDLRTSSSHILRRTFLGAAVAGGDIAWTKLLLKQGVLPYSNARLFDIALSTKYCLMINLLWQSGFTGHVRLQHLGNLDTDVRFIVLRNLLRVTRPTLPSIFKKGYSSLEERYCGNVLIEEASKGRTIEVTVLMGLYGSAIDWRWLGVALRAATRFRHFQTAEYLISSGVDIHASGGLISSILLDLEPCSLWQRMTPIQIAAERNDIHLVKLLLHHGATPNPFRTGPSADFVGLTPLQYAAQNRNFDMVRVLLDAGSHSDSSMHVAQGDTPLQIAIRMDDERTCGLLLSSGASVNSRPASTNGRTALQAAAGTGNIPVAQMLIEKGAFINASPGIDGGMTALQAAAFGGHSAMVELLVAKGADVNARPAHSGGMTALQAAAASGNKEIINGLIRLGADVKGPIVHYHGKPPLEAAVPHRDLDLLETLINHGVEVDTVHSFVRATALEIASQIGWLDGAKYLLHRGAKANVHIMGDNGCSCVTALEWAIKNNDYPMVQLLLENDAVDNIASMDFSRRVLCQSLSEGNDVAIVKLLLQYDPDPEITFSDGRPFKLAIYRSYPHLEIYKLLLERMAVLPKRVWMSLAESVWRYIPARHLHKRMDSAVFISIVDQLLEACVDIAGHIQPSSVCLQAALRQGDEELADYLLSRDVTSDAPAAQDFGTPLQEAIANGCYNVIPKMLQGGADPNAAPCLNRRDAMTAIQAAADKGLMNVARILLEAGADITACHNGRTAIQLAARKGRIDMVALLLKWLPIDANLLSTCETAAYIAESENYVDLAEWLRQYPTLRDCRIMEL